MGTTQSVCSVWNECVHVCVSVLSAHRLLEEAEQEQEVEVLLGSMLPMVLLLYSPPHTNNIYCKAAKANARGRHECGEKQRL